MIAPTSFFADTGCHVRILEEARALRSRGHEVAICTYRKGRDVDGFDIHRTLPLPWRQDYEVGSSRHKLAYDSLLVPLVLRQALRLRPDVIHAHLHEGALIGGLVSRLTGIPLLFDFQGSAASEMVDHHFLNPNGRWYRPMSWLERHIDHLPRAIITSSHHGAELLRSQFGVPYGRITTIADCVNAETFRPGVITAPERDSLRQSLGIPAGASLVVYLGLLAEHQGIGLLLRAAQQVVRDLSDTYFLIMGYPGAEGYRTYAQAIGIGERAVLTGRLPYDQAPRYLALGDIAVAPKVSLTEGAGKLLNYMAMALPTVAFETAVNREYLGDLGIYPATTDERGLAEALLQSLREPRSLRSVGDGLRRRALERYAWGDAGQRIESVYQRILTSSKASRPQ
jgi:glycosyltransferase involved in cell wall biosynthesis